jgi:hypothetical protein
MEIVELEKCESNETQENHPRLPAVELIVVVSDSPHYQFHGGLGEKQGVCRKDAAYASICHAFDDSDPVRVARVYTSQKKGAGHYECDHDEGSDQPDEKLMAP